MDSLFYVLLAILGLSFLIFIHELGHYYMARKVGMRVETFAIGFGHPIASWVRANGEKWQIGWLLFGGYVKIAGTDTDDQDPYTVPDGFFAKSPLDRIKVAFMGPFVNLVFALGLFALLWLAQGREKNFSEFSAKIGWVDPSSELYSKGIRPGDEVLEYNGSPYSGSKDHLYVPMTSTSDEVIIKGNKVNYKSGEKSPFEIAVKSYPHPNSLEKGILTTGITNSASYIIYDRLPNGGENPLPEGSPLLNSGIQYGDRIVWVDGEMIFSLPQLNHILNEGRALLTIQRGSDTLLVRVPRVSVQELRLDSQFRDELIDWQYEAGLNGKKIQNLFAIPYDLTNDGVVQSRVKFIDKDNEKEAFPVRPYSALEIVLQPGDKILAVNGEAVSHASDILNKIQTNRVNIIVERNASTSPKASWKNEDTEFDREVDYGAITKIASAIGTSSKVTESGSFHLLNPVTPAQRGAFFIPPEKQAKIVAEIQNQRKQIEGIEDPEKRMQALRLLDIHEKQLLLGLPNVQDKKVNYNPLPTELFSNLFNEIWRTLKALFTGTLNPKFISGPIGIVQVMTDNWMVSIKEAVFWLGAISLNLGVLNLLPIPMLDGGMIVMSLIEMITGRRLHPKTMEKIIIPFAVLLIGFFIFLTYNDLSRLLGGFLIK